MAHLGQGPDEHFPADDRSRERERALVILAAGAVGLAGAIHLALTDEQFRRGPAVGVIFLALGIYQILSGAALLVRPGPRAYRAGTWGGGLIVAAYVATKVIPIPAAPVPLAISAPSVTATILDLTALILLATVLPDRARSTRRGRRIPAWLAGLFVGLAAPVAWLFVTGALQWVSYDAFPVSPVPRLSWNPNRSGLITPALYGFVTDRVVTGWLYLFLPWWTGIGAAVLGMLAGANVWLAMRLRDGPVSCPPRRTGLLGLLPAAFAAPVCCAVPLGALFGISTATLYTGAPLLTAAGLGLLTWNVLTLDRIRRAGGGLRLRGPLERGHRGWTSRSPPTPGDDMLTHDLDTLSLTLAESFSEPVGEEVDRARFQETILRFLAEGNPVPVETIAAATGQAASEIERVLGAGGAEMDEQGRLVGLGLTIRETPHRFTVGGRSLYTWCALDTLIFPAVLGPAQVESPCRATGTMIRVEVTTAGVERVEPAEAVVSIVRPRPGLPIRASFCNDVHFFRSAEAAVPWLDRHPSAIVLPVADAFELGARLAAGLYPGARPS